MDLKDNIKRFRELKNISVPKLAALIGVGKQSVYDWEEGKYGPSPDNLDQLAKALGIQKKDLFEENLTAEIKSTGSKEMENNKESIYRDLVEANTEYRLVPKTILDEEYRIVLKSEIESKEKMLWQVIEAKNNLIDQLHKEIAELRSEKPVPAMHAKEA